MFADDTKCAITINYSLEINPLQSAIPYMFADDTKCAITINYSLEINPLQSDLIDLSTWSSTWSLLFNESKFVHMRFWQKNTSCSHTYLINGNTIDQKTQHKDLGVILTIDLNWSPHYNYIISQSYKTLGLLRRTFTHSTCASRKKLYFISTLTATIL